MLIPVSNNTYPRVEEQVVRFDVPVDEAEVVYGVDSQDGLGHVELRLLLCQCVLLHQQRHHVTWWWWIEGER